MKTSNTQIQNGFVLATLIVISTVMLIVGATLLQTIVSTIKTYNESYYTSVATQAAEAGVVMANTCVTNNNYQQTWPTSTPMTQKMSCTGATDGSARDYVLNDTQIRSRFAVEDITKRIDGALIIKSTGTVDIMSGTTVLRSKSVVVNQMVTWPVNYSGGTNSSGWERTCGIVSKAAYCWGSNEVGQLGDGTTNNSTVPVKVRQDAYAGQTVTAIRSGHSHNCVVANKKVYCWGFNNYGQLGNNTQTNSSIPVAVTSAWGTQDVTDIATSSMSSCAIAGGDIYCWGRNNVGQLGINSGSTQVIVPTKITGLPSTATKLMTSGAGMETMCAIVGGGVYCWGRNTVGQVGDGTLTDRSAPVAITTNLSGKTVTDISGDAAWSGNVGVVGSTTGGHVCAIASSQAYCWGNNRVNSNSPSGEVGAASTNPYFTTPRAVSTSVMSSPVTEIITGSYHSCAIAGGEVFCWGRNNFGQLGNRTYGSVASANAPVRVAQDEGVFLNKTVSQLGGGFNRGCGVVDQKTYCWGNNSSGQIGDGTSGNVRDYPTESIFLRPRAPVFLF